MKTHKKLITYLLLFSLIIPLLQVTPSLAIKKSTGTPVYIKVGETERVYIDITQGTKVHISWKSSNTNIATVSKKGNIKGIGGGSCKVTAKIKYKLKGHIYYAKHYVPVTVTGTPAKPTPKPTKKPKPTTKPKKVMTEKKAYKKIIAQKSKYPQGKKWNTKNKYVWESMKKVKKKNGIKYVTKINLKCKACMAYAARISDAVWGKGKRNCKKVKNPESWQPMVGDILVISSNNPDKPKQKHAVVVLKKNATSWTVTEGNLRIAETDKNGQLTGKMKGIISWTRKIPKSERIYYMYTRYKKSERVSPPAG